MVHCPLRLQRPAECCNLIRPKDMFNNMVFVNPTQGFAHYGSGLGYQRHYPTVLGIFCDNLAEMSRLLHLSRGVVLVFRPPPVPSSLSFFFLLNFIPSCLVAALEAKRLNHSSHLFNLGERQMNSCWEGMWGPAQRYAPQSMSSGWLR